MRILTFGDFCEEIAALVGPDYPEHVWTACPDPVEALRQAPEHEAIVAIAPAIRAELVRAMPRLAWIHALTTGVDNLLAMPGLAPGVVLTRTHGIHGPQMSELTMLLMLAMPRQLPRIVENQRRQVWEKFAQPVLAGKTVCIVGVGAISEALARRCGAFEMRVTGISDARATAPGFDLIRPRSELAAGLAEADFVVVLVPHTAATHHIIDDAALSAMKPTAYLINVARGGCVDEDALLRHLRAGTIAGAGLDVFATEPLPPGNPLWDEPRALIVPHLGGMSDIYPKQAAPILRRALDALRAGGLAALPDRVPHGRAASEETP